MAGGNVEARSHRMPHEWPFALGLALLLALFVASVLGAVQDTAREVPVRLALAEGQDGASLSGDRRALLLPAGRVTERHATLQFTLPLESENRARWVVWIGRDAVESVSLSAGGWSSAERSFFRPMADEGILPSGFQFPLPDDWRGDVSLDLRVSAAQSATLRVRVMRENAAMRLEQRGAALSAAIYAALATLSLLTLALSSAARDRIFLVFFGAAVAALVLLAAENGHLYQLPVLGVAAIWRGQGLWAAGALFVAVSLQLLSRYAGTRRALPDLSRAIDIFAIMLSALAAVCLLGIAAVDAWIRPVGVLAWCVAAITGLVVVVDGARRSVPMAWPIALLVLATILVSIGVDVVFRGRWFDPVWLRYVWQSVLVVTGVVLAVGLISRIGEYRNQRDHDRLARADSERRMRREAARSELSAMLQQRLRTLSAGDVEWAGFRLLLEHLTPQVPVEFAAVMAYGYQGQDIVAVLPLAHQPVVEDIAARRLLPLKRQAANGIPMQQPVTLPTRQGVVAMEAVIPLGIRAPAWGALVLQRTGGDGFSTEELALAGDLARLTMAGIEQALAAISLRRSAEVDALTGSMNRRTIDQWLVRSFADADRDGQPMSVLFVDMDHFKAINDRHGHGCGDQCLRQVAATLRGALADGDLLGRYGGEEFIAVLPGRGGAAGRVVGEDLRAAVERMAFSWEGQPVRLTVSVGVATRLAGEGTPAATVDRADKALYAAKRDGRNRVMVAPAIFS